MSATVSIANAFLNPGLLGWLALAAVPIIIHLLFRRRTRRVDWAAMHFLERAHKRTKRRIQLENLLLLLLRVAAVALLVFAAARPLLRATSPIADLAHTQRHAAIIVDVSGSMDYGASGLNNPFGSAKAATRKLIGGLNPGSGDTAVIIPHAAPEANRSRSPSGYVDPEAMRRYVENTVQVTPGATAFAEALDVARRALIGHETGREVYLISDLQRNGFGADGKVSDAVRDAMTKLDDEGTRVFVIDVGPDEVHPANCGIVSLDTPPRVITTAESTAVVARVKNFGAGPARVGVRFFVGDEEEPRGFAAPQQLEAGDEETFLFRYRRFDKDGPMKIRAELDPPDAFRFDDKRDLVVTVRKRVRVLLVDGAPQNTDAFTNATDYLATALNPFASGSDEQGPFEPEVIPWHELPRRDPERYDLVILANVAIPGEAEMFELNKFVRNGGGLLITWGTNLDNAALFRERFVTKFALSPLIPDEPTGDPDWNAPEATPRRIVFDPNHDATRSFAANEVMQALVGEVRIGRFMTSTVVKNEDGDIAVLARFDNAEASPAIAERVVGAGRVIVMTTTADVTWTNLPDTPIFLPLVHALASHVLRPVRDPLNLTVGDRVRRLFGENVGNKFDLEAPGGRGVTVVATAVPVEDSTKEATRYRLRSDPLLERGVYRLRPLTSTAPAELIAVNPAPEEGDLRRYRVPDLRVDVFPTQQFQGLSAEDIEVSTADGPRGGEFWKFLIGAVIVFLLAESWFAQRTGARKA